MDATSTPIASVDIGEDEAAIEGQVETQLMASGSASALPPEFEVPPALGSLPLQLDVAVPVRGFRVRDLLRLEKGAVIASEWPNDEDLPIWCGGAQLVWTEFEVVDDVLAVRVTRVL
ncbi:FliM/FliN family flagellar motor switch protein [Silvibacterium sp.]|uniref:FliM/FliN family flagellar motor switch protein n=1 Tax=Silvibacterium sp. TaxID=1964179 RepID=UPI0039E54BCD